MSATPERKLHELADVGTAQPATGPGRAAGIGRPGRIAMVGTIVVLECAWLVAVAYLVWRLFASV